MQLRWLMMAALAFVAGCAQIERAQVAQKAQGSMVGMSKEQVLACMGPPANRMAEGGTEVWQYTSGNSQRDEDIVVSAYTNSASSVSTVRSCTINVVMSGGAVARVNYLGNTGGLLSQSEQCGYAVKGCI